MRVDGGDPRSETITTVYNYARRKLRHLMIPANSYFSSGPRGTAQRKLALLVLFQLVFSTVYITYLSRTFEYGNRLIVFHVCVVATALALAALTFGLLLRIARSTAVRRAASLSSAAAFAILVVLYGADLVSHRHWGGSITYELVGFYIVRLQLLLSYITVATNWSHVGIILGVAALGAFYIMRSGIVTEGLVAFFDFDGAEGRRTLVSTGCVSSVALLTVSASLILVFSLKPKDRTNLLVRDPIVGFVLDENSLHQFVLSRYSNRSAEEDLIVRARYPINQTFDRRNVVLIVADSLRPDHMQVYGYERPTTPFLDHLRRSGRLSQVKLALATCPDSPCGVSSIMTSKTFGSLVPQNFKLHELLFDQGYAVHFIVSGDHREWFDMKRFYGKDLTSYFDGHNSRSYSMSDDRLIFEGFDRVARFNGKPAFFYFHLMSAHMIGKRLARHQVYESSNRGIFESNPILRINNYDNSVLQVDAMIEQIFEALKDKGYLENALIVILGDHGEGLGEHPGLHGFGHRSWLYQPTLRIPLLIYDQVGTTYANLKFATHVDVAPTIIHRLGLQIPSSWEGKSLLDPTIKPYSYHYTDVRPFYAVVHATGGAVYKYLRQANREELFELTSDPDERRNLMSSAEDNLLRGLRERLTSVLTAPQP